MSPHSVRRFPNMAAMDPENLRMDLLTLILKVSVFLGCIVYVPSVLLGMQQHLYGVVVMDTVAVGVVTVLYRMTRLSFSVRAAGVCAIYYLLGVGLLVSVGPICQIYLIGFSIVTVLLFGVQVGVGAAALSAVSLLAVGLFGVAAPAMVGPAGTPDRVGWFVITINFALVNILLTLAVGAVLGAVTSALRVAVVNGLSLDDERNVLRTLIDTLPDFVVTKDTHGRFVNSNAACLAQLGAASESEIRGKTVFDVYPGPIAESYHADDVAVLAGRTIDNREDRGLDAQGNTMWFLTDKVPLRDATGAISGLISVTRDITAHKQLEEQLRQSQKMDAVGQLAGGIAHDFNNQLAVILTYSELVLEETTSDVVREDVQEIRNAGLRAADLTRQLLTFSRQQIVQPTVLDPNDVLTGMDKLLRRLIGANVELACVPGAGVGWIRADRSSIEHMIVNLMVNARDALADGGRIVVETANVTVDEELARGEVNAVPGEYVLLSVTDTGCGMDKQTLGRIFEPFFTTKERGKGTGLGLSTVLGSVQQAGGFIRVSSEPGVGTTFGIHLPRAAPDADVIRLEASETLRGSETILLVEDEAALRAVARSILERHGYTVLDAASAADALRVATEQSVPIHLLLTDIVMPGESGPVLAARLAVLRPDMRVLYMSGHADDAAVRHGFTDGALSFVQKPFTIARLTDAVRSVLDTVPG